VQIDPQETKAAKPPKGKQELKSTKELNAQAKAVAEKIAQENAGPGSKNLTSHGFKTKGMKFVDAKITKMGKTGNTELKIFDKDLFDYSMITICTHLVHEECTCQTVSLRRNKFTLNGFMMLLNTIDYCKTLQTINYLGNVIGELPPLENRDLYDHFDAFTQYLSRGADGAHRLGEKLKTNTTLTTLNLEENSLKDEGIEYITEALEVNTTIKHLRISKNLVGDKGVQSVCKALLKNNTLESLDLDSNKFTPPAVNLLSRRCTTWTRSRRSLSGRTTSTGRSLRPSPRPSRWDICRC
jgi:hypothetical protein